MEKARADYCAGQIPVFVYPEHLADSSASRRYAFYRRDRSALLRASSFFVRAVPLRKLLLKKDRRV